MKLVAATARWWWLPVIVVGVASLIGLGTAWSGQTPRLAGPPCPNGVVRTVSVESEGTFLAVAVCATPRRGPAGASVSFLATTTFRNAIRPSLAVCGSSFEYGDEALIGTPVPRCRPLCSTGTPVEKRSGTTTVRIPDHTYTVPGRYTATLTLAARSPCDKSPFPLAILKLPVEIW